MGWASPPDFFRIGFVLRDRKVPKTPVTICRNTSYLHFAPSGNWVRFAQLLPGGASRPQPPAPIPGRSGEIGFVSHNWPAQAGGGKPQGWRPATGLSPIRNVVTPGSDRGPKSAIEKLASFCTIGSGQLGSFVQPPTSY
jgi:hypothetical protein